MTPRQKLVSVIVPTYNRAGLLDLTLKTLENQSINRSSIEIVVADDGSSDNTAEVVELYKRYLPIKYVFQEDLGYRVASARNLAINNSEGEILVFVDSGVLVSAGFLESHLNSHLASKDDIAVVGNVLGLQLEDNAFNISAYNVDQIISQFTESQIFLDLRDGVFDMCDSDLSRLPAPWALFWTGNVSVKRSIVLEAGMFDTKFDGRWGMEDVELAYRLWKRNVQFKLNRHASAIHFPHPSDTAAKLEQEKHNKLYMHSKHGSPETLALLTSDTVNINLVLDGMVAK